MSKFNKMVAGVEVATKTLSPTKIVALFEVIKEVKSLSKFLEYLVKDFVNHVSVFFSDS